MTNDQKTSYTTNGSGLLSKIKELIREGNVRSLVIKSESGKVYLKVPVTVGAIGILIAPPLAVIGALGALTGVFIIEVEPMTESDSPKTSAKRRKA